MIGPKYELHFNGEVLEGSLEELKEFAKDIKPYWELFKIYGSDLNKYQYKRLSVTDVREIMKMRKKGWTYTGLANRYNCSHTRMNIMLKALNI